MAIGLLGYNGPYVPYNGLDLLSVVGQTRTYTTENFFNVGMRVHGFNRISTDVRTIDGQRWPIAMYFKCGRRGEIVVLIPDLSIQSKVIAHEFVTCFTKGPVDHNCLGRLIDSIMKAMWLQKREHEKKMH